ncbi:MAG: rod shape-determining protein [Dysgonamonadaceae bacterium]|jgi:cell division protein FtsA|nr:rod shape-determining protein [Dysgonamonadaceae bacterium]
MEQTKYVVALDLGTSKMLAVAAKKNGKGRLLILNSEKTAAGCSILRGRIHNIEETAENVRSLVNRLSRKLNPGIKKIYVGIGGQSLHTEYYSVKKEINGLVTEETIKYLDHECRQYEPAWAKILKIIPMEYYVDGSLSKQPKGVYCKEIEAKFLLILGRPSLENCLEKSIKEKAKIEIAGFFISPLATAEVALTERDKELGCALVEMGAGVTYLSIYKDKLLKYLVTIPLGGNVITKDLCSLDILEAEAEKLKIKEGIAPIESEKEEKSNEIIEARANEIVANLVEQIKQSGYESLLGAGIIMTGGGSLLQNLDKLMALKTEKQVRLAAVEDHTQACVLGLLTLGEEDCAKEVLRTPPTEPEIFDPGDVETIKTPTSGNKGHKQRETKGEKTGKVIIDHVKKIFFGEDDNTQSNS